MQHGTQGDGHTQRCQKIIGRIKIILNFFLASTTPIVRPLRMLHARLIPRHGRGQHLKENYKSFSCSANASAEFHNLVRSDSECPSVRSTGSPLDKAYPSDGS